MSMSNNSGNERLSVSEPSGIRIDPELDQSVVSGIQAGSSTDDYTYNSARSRDPPSAEEQASRTSNQRPYEYSSSAGSGTRSPPRPASNSAVRGSATTIPTGAPPSSTREPEMLPTYKQQCMAGAAPIVGSTPNYGGEPILVQADPVSESQLIAERQMEEQKRSQQLKDQSRDRQSQQEQERSEASAKRNRKLLWLSLFGLLIILALGAVVGGICGSGQCSPSESQNDVSSRGIPSPVPVPQTPAPTTLSPSMAPIPLTREMLVARTIQDVTLFPRNIEFPLPTNPTAEEEALSWLILDDPATIPASRTVALIQRYVLATLWFRDVVPRTNTYVDTWLTLDDECDWEGVDCQGGELRTLDIRNNTVSGRLPVDLGLLTTLTTLAIVDNSLAGTIPSSISRLTELDYLGFEGNKLSGTIPSSLGSLIQLTRLSLFENSLEGEIPDFSNLRRLQSFALYQNNLGGNLPTYLGFLTSLTYLGVHDNAIGGTIPDLRDLSNLGILSLGENLIAGTIPSSIGLMTSLSGIFLDQARLRGSIPTEVSNLSRLQFFFVYDNFLTGSIPPVNSLTALENFEVNDNGLTGTFPEFGPLPLLDSLWLNDNLLDGTLPSSYGNMSVLRQLALYNNMISSSIPSTYGGLTNLVFLGMFGNPITGTIPTELNALTKLTSTYLFNMELKGSVPFCNITDFSRENLVVDCNEVDCPCCTQCCPTGGWDGIPSWNSNARTERCDA